jgi:adenylylsulfate kinase-like enzyme
MGRSVAALTIIGDCQAPAPMRRMATVMEAPSPHESSNTVNTVVILIGPIGAGKSTVGKLLSVKLGLLQIETDELRWKYYEEIGYDAALARKKNETEGFWSMYQ